MEDDTITGGEELSIDEAAAAYTKATAEEVQEDQTEPEDEELGEADDDELQASEDNEDAGDEDDGEPEGDEDQAEEGDEDEQETEAGRYVGHDGRVRLPDGTEATVSELIAGNLKNADATKKWQEAAELRRDAETRSATIEATEKQLQERAEYVTSLLQSIVPPPPDLSMLQTDPMGYMSQKAEHEQWTQHLTFLQQEQQRTQHERQAKSQETERETLNREWQELVAKVPEFKEQKQVDRFARELQEHAQAYGIKPEELKRVAMDHRQALVLKDAIAWRKLQASKANVAKKVEGRPPVTKGGKRLDPKARQTRQATDAFKRLQSSGRTDDAVAAYLALQKG